MNGKVLECIHKATGDRRALKVGTSGRGGLLLELGDPGLFVGWLPRFDENSTKAIQNHISVLYNKLGRSP